MLRNARFARGGRAGKQDGISFLERFPKDHTPLVDCLSGQSKWAGFPNVVSVLSDGDMDKAKRAIGLFNAYCARCHTAGYSAGVAYTKEIGSGGLGPALRAGRANIQFKQREDMIDFIVKGSVNGKAYGVNGVGGGKMPGFGAVLPESDIALIIDYLRSAADYLNCSRLTLKRLEFSFTDEI